MNESVTRLFVGQPRLHRVCQKHTGTQKDRQTDGHGDSMTESAQWGGLSVNQNVTKLKKIKL